MMKFSRKALIEAFTGFGNKAARNEADSLGGNLSATPENIAKVNKTLENQNGQKAVGIKGFFELAAHAWKSMRATCGTSGRPYKPTFAFAAPEPR